MPLFPARHSPLLRQLVFGVKVGLAAHCFAAYVGYVQLTDGPSMLPTLPVRGAYVWVSARHRQGRGVRAGDVVSLRHPLRPGEGMGKRILGMPGDFVLRDTPGSGSEVMVQVSAPTGPMLPRMALRSRGGVGESFADRCMGRFPVGTAGSRATTRRGRSTRAISGQCH